MKIKREKKIIKIEQGTLNIHFFLFWGKERKAKKKFFSLFFFVNTFWFLKEKSRFFF